MKAAFAWIFEDLSKGDKVLCGLVVGLIVAAVVVAFLLWRDICQERRRKKGTHRPVQPDMGLFDEGLYERDWEFYEGVKDPRPRD